MAFDVLQKMDPDNVKSKYSKLYSKVLELKSSGHTPIESIKEIKEIGKISLSEAKRIYLAAIENKSLEEHEEEIWAELIAVLDSIDGVSVTEGNMKRME